MLNLRLIHTLICILIKKDKKKKLIKDKIELKPKRREDNMGGIFLRIFRTFERQT
jgi:hypothetical protein